jgi:hypothetical protein
MMPRWLQTLLDGLVYVVKRVVPRRPKPGPDVPRFEVKEEKK